MSTGKPTSLKALFGGSDSAVGRLIRRSAEVEALTSQVKALVPEPLRPHILTAHQHDGTLFLVADAAVWAAELRYLAADIRISLSARQGTSLQKVKVRVGTGRGPAT